MDDLVLTSVDKFGDKFRDNFWNNFMEIFGTIFNAVFQSCFSKHLLFALKLVKVFDVNENVAAW